MPDKLGPENQIDGTWVHQHMYPDLGYEECWKVANYINDFRRIERELAEQARLADKRRGMFA